MAGPALCLRASVDDETRRAIESVVTEHGTLEHVLRWAYADAARHEVVRVVGQDEFTNDVVVRWDAKVFLVYDCT